jgi:predicted proteasome-type protease
VASLVADGIRDLALRDGPRVEGGSLSSDASFILGGQISSEEMRLFCFYAEGNFIEAGIRLAPRHEIAAAGET